jgi:RHS repeat-associated protein
MKCLLFIFFILSTLAKGHATPCPTPESYRAQMQEVATWCNRPPADPSLCIPVAYTSVGSYKLHIQPNPNTITGNLDAICQAYNCAGERNPWFDDRYPSQLCTNYPATVSVGIPNYKVTNSCGSIIENINRVVGEEIKLTGVPFTLIYNSKFTTGFKNAYKIDIPITKATVPSYLTNIVLTVKDINNSIVNNITYLPVPNQTYSYIWNGLDSGSIQTWGRIKRTITIKENTPDFNVDIPPYEVFFGTLKANKLGVGGWLPSIWAFYDFESKTFYGGDGTNRSVTAVADGSYFRVASSDSKLVYFFDSIGKLSHIKTWLTGTAIFNFAYDGSGRLSTITQPFNKITTFSRNSSGQLLQIIAPNGAVTTISLDSNGYLSQVLNPINEAHSMTYYGSDGLINTFTAPSGDVTTMTYNSNGELVSDVHSNGFSATLSAIAKGVQSNSALGRITKSLLEAPQETIIKPSGFTKYIINDPTYTSIQSATDYKTKWFAADPRFGDQATRVQSSSFDDFGSRYSSYSNSTSLNSSTDPFSINTIIDTETVGNSINTSTYTGSDKTISFTTKLGKTAKIQIDQYERPILTQVGNLNSKVFTYTNNLMTGITEGTRSNTLVYNTLGLLQSVSNSLTQTTSFTYDTAQRLKTTTLPDTRVITYNYDYNGNLTSLTPPLRSNVTPAGLTPHGMVFGTKDKLTSYAPPTLSGVTTVNTTYTYDNDKQLTQITRPDGKIINLNYDATTGLMSSISGTFGIITKSYTNELPIYIEGLYSDSLAIGYNHSTPVSLNYTKNTIDIYAYSRSATTPVGGKVGSETIIGKGVGSVDRSITYAYDDDEYLTNVGGLILSYNTPNGQLTGTTLGNITDVYTYNTFGEVATYEAKYNTTSLYKYVLTRDAIGRVSQKVETLNGVVKTFVYTYDSAGRLTLVTTNGVTTSTYTYDQNSNRSGGVIGGVTTTTTYDRQDRLTNYNGTALTYNANGEILTKGAATFTYDYFGNLKTYVNGTTNLNYEIDPNQRRLGRILNSTLTARYIYNPEGKLVGLLDGTNKLVKTFVYGTKGHVPDYFIDSAGSKFRIITDYLGSVRLVVSSTGVVVQRMEHDEFGKVKQDTSVGYTPFGFAGGLYDASLGLVRFGARDYDSQTGRWLSKDPILFGPGQMNLYGYTFNDPINYIDPSGLFGITIGAGASAGIAESPSSANGCAVEASSGVAFGLDNSSPEIGGFISSGKGNRITGAQAGAGLNLGFYFGNLKSQGGIGRSQSWVLGPISFSKSVDGAGNMSGGSFGIGGHGFGLSEYFTDTNTIINSIGR